MPTDFHPRVVDAAILVTLIAVLATGLLSLVAGTADHGWVFVVHGIAGVLLVPLLALKLVRVAPRLRRPGAWSPPVVVSVLATLLAVAALATGLLWVSVGSFRVGPWPGLAFHAILGVVLVPILLVHLRRRFRLPRRQDVEGRRTALQATALVLSGALAWRVQQAIADATSVTGRRFTGSREAGTEGNDFPVTSWVADDPTPVDPREWTLAVTGSVETDLALDPAELTGAPDHERATLDCTSGWYAERDWQGIRLSRVLDRSGPTADAAWVTIESVTGYRVCLPLEEAREALLATHVGDEPLSHGHGAPTRLVAPGRRGFQWVKWVRRIEVRETPDYGAWVSIFTSGFTPDPS